MATTTAIDFSEFGFYGIRTDERTFQVGDTLPASFVWIDGEKTDEELDGTCATEIDGENLDKALRIHNREGYVGTRYVIAGDEMVYGEDAGEIIIRDAVVVAIL